MKPDKRICVFCGARPGSDPSWMSLARAVGQSIARRGYGVVYGGGGVGLMGAVAAGALDEEGEVIGVIPHSLMAQELGNLNVTRLEKVESMAVRKTRMIDLADGFVSLPGGLGTLDELFEVMTLRQIGFHQKPNGILNANGYFDDLFALVNGFADKGFVGQQDLDALIVDAHIEPLLDQMFASAPVNQVARET
ncbi:MAG: TIGR00730 family Rossman fold protein [Burkholderiaceae bacterium]